MQVLIFIFQFIGSSLLFREKYVDEICSRCGRKFKYRFEDKDTYLKYHNKLLCPECAEEQRKNPLKRSTDKITGIQNSLY